MSERAELSRAARWRAAAPPRRDRRCERTGDRGAETHATDLLGRRYAIVGGGISGLAAAWYLQRRGAETHIVERDRELGGRAASGELGSRSVTLGGKNIGRAYARFRAFTSDHGEHAYEPFGINSSRVLDGRLIRFDSGHRARTLLEARRTHPADAVRLARLVRLLRRDPDTRFLSERTCALLARRYGSRTLAEVFGERLRELLLRSLTVRVSAAEPHEVPLANALPYVAMLLDNYDQLAGGIDRVIDDAGKRSRLSLGAEVLALTVEHGRVCGVELRRPGQAPTRERFDGVVLATPARAAADLLGAPAPAAAALLREVRYFPLVVLLAEYEQPVFGADLRAIVFGAERALSNAGAYGIDELDTVRYTFSGERARELVEGEPDPERLAALGEASLAPHANVVGNRRRAIVARRFAPGLCAYHPDQARMLRALGPALAGLRGLAVTGDYLCGCSIEACFASAERAIASLAPDADALGRVSASASSASATSPAPR